MERDWELVRKILVAIEKQGSSAAHLEPTSIDGYGSDTVSYHFYILKQAGLIDATCLKTVDVGLECIAKSLTWDGHEFLDKVRSDTIWNKVKTRLTDKGIDMSLEAIKTAATAVIMSLVS